MTVGRFEGKVAVVVGAAGGIGAALVRRLAGEGATVIFGDVDKDLAQQSLARLSAEGLTAEFIPCDGTNRQAVEALIDGAVARHGRIDCLHANVGGVLGIVPDVAEATDEQWDRLYQMNLRSAHIAARAAVPHMLRQGKGAITFSASVSGLVAMPGQGAYGVMKAGINQMVRSMAIDYARKGIRVNCVCPGPTATGVIARTAQSTPDPDAYIASVTEKVPMGRMGEPEEIAASLAFLLSDDASFTTGVSLPVDGGLLSM